MLNRIVKLIGGDPTKKAISEYSGLVDEINALEPGFVALSDEGLSAKTGEFRRRLAGGESLDDLLPEAFSAVREASKRTIGLRHFDVQLIGGAVLHQGRIAEMRTGEGKTLVATLPLYLNALAFNPAWVELARKRFGQDPSRWEFVPIDGIPTGRGTHLITVNDYLARRDARWKAPIYHMLGLQVGVLQMAARAEGGSRGYLVDLEASSSSEDQHQMRQVHRRVAYAADITYGTNSEYGFDYLRDNMAMRLEDRVQRGHHFAIIDEVDNVLIDEARTPLIISGPSHDDTEWYVRMAQVVRQLGPESYEIDEKSRTVILTEFGEVQVERVLEQPLRDPERPEDITPEQARLLGYLEQALRAQHLFRRNKEYLVQAGKVVIIDEFTGRLMPGRRWSDGLHQAVEAKEGVRVQRENVTYATITIQNYFRMYEKLAGMTGTALTEAEEFDKIYSLEVVAIPTNLEYQAARPETGLVSVEDRDEEGYKLTYYTRSDDTEQAPLFWKRQDYPDVVFRSEEAKLRSIVAEIIFNHVKGKPLLVGTTSVELSERLSGRLRGPGVNKLAQVLLLRDRWFEKNNLVEDGREYPDLVFLNQPLDRLPPAEMRALARDLELTLNLSDPGNLSAVARAFGLSSADEPRLSEVLSGGVTHQVLNARKHTEESQIIAGAGAFGAVTIATNMAGRGVDIKLGGELQEEALSSVNRVLQREGIDDPFDMTMEERRQALGGVDLSGYGIYEADVVQFLKYIEDMERVRLLGGLHVIGSERHDARRIDNQLRGRAARQGDPGSSRFYLSMEDELMRLFGGESATEWMRRFKVDEAVPLEHGMVGRLIEQAQTRVEGANFDARKHLLEYDDVLNTQRGAIYSQRDRIFVKEDLGEDVNEMLETEILERVPQALEDTEGPWRLLAWLDQIQPPINLKTGLYPSFTLRILKDKLTADGVIDRQQVRPVLAGLADDALKAEEDHHYRSVELLLDQGSDWIEAEREDRTDAVETFAEGLALMDEESEPMTASEAASELESLIRIPLRLSPKEERAFFDDPESMVETILDRVHLSLFQQACIRLTAAVQRRVEGEISISQGTTDSLDWERFGADVLDEMEMVFERRRERLLGEAEGQIRRDLERQLGDASGELSETEIFQLLLMMPQGTRAVFDRKTHRRVWERTTRLVYTHHAATLLENRDPNDLAREVLEHLQGAQRAVQRAWGLSEVGRLGESRPIDLDERAQRGLRSALGDESYASIEKEMLSRLEDPLLPDVVDELGRQALTEVYRQLLLGVISELWVEYLTEMESLRVSIGLEAYAQRDPLVQYKSRAFEMYRKLLSDMRIGVVSRMFVFRPRDLSAVQAEARAPELEEEVELAVEEGIAEAERAHEDGDGAGQAEPSKRRRRRRRK